MDFIRSLDSERRKRQHLKNQVQWYDRRESKHLRSAYNVRSLTSDKRLMIIGKRSVQRLTLTKQAPGKTIQWSGSPRLWLTPPQKKSPGGISEAMR